MIPVYNIEISHSSNACRIEPVIDEIITLEDTNASLPYGSSSGSWGLSGATFTERVGTPIGADIVYFAVCEDTFYHLKVDFPIEKMKELTRRAYAVYDTDCFTGQEYIDILENPELAKCRDYEKMGDLVFGFAPKGVVVVWLRFGIQQIEIGQFQAEVIKDDKAYEEKLFKTWSRNRKEVKAAQFIPDASPDLWISYRQKYTWESIATSTNKDFRFLSVLNEYYNGESEMALQPWLSENNMRKRAVPRELTFYFTTGKDEQYEGRVFFDFDQMTEAFKKAGPNAKMEFRISPDNSDYEIFLNGEPLEVKSKRLFKNDIRFKDSYK